MAVVVGESEARSSVKASFQEKRLEVSNPADLAPLLHKLRRRYEQGLDPLYQAFDEKLSRDEAALAMAKAGLTSEIARQTQPLLEEAYRIERALEENRSCSWLRRFTILLLPTLRLMLRKKAVYASEDKMIAALHNDLLFWGLMPRRLLRWGLVILVSFRRRGSEETAFGPTFLKIPRSLLR